MQSKIMTTKPAVKSRNSKRDPTVTPPIIPCVQHVTGPVEGF